MEAVEGFRSLIQSEAWGVYQHHMEQTEARYIERLVGGSREDFERTKGIIEGLRLAYNYPTLWLKQQEG